MCFSVDLRCHLNFVEKQVEKFDPLLDWMASEFGFKPVVHFSFFGGKQEDGLVKAVENFLKKTDDCELAAIDALAAAAHSLTIAIGLVNGRLQIEEAIELIRLEEDLQVFVTLNFLALSLSHTHSTLWHYFGLCKYPKVSAYTFGYGLLRAKCKMQRCRWLGLFQNLSPSGSHFGGINTDECPLL